MYGRRTLKARNLARNCVWTRQRSAHSLVSGSAPERQNVAPNASPAKLRAPERQNKSLSLAAAWADFSCFTCYNDRDVCSIGQDEGLLNKAKFIRVVVPHSCNH